MTASFPLAVLLAVTVNAPPQFSPADPCGSRVAIPALAAQTNVFFSASDPDETQTVSLAPASLPPWATFSQSPGNPATAMLTASPTIFDWLFGLLFPASAVITATDNGTPQQSAQCRVDLGLVLF